MIDKILVNLATDHTWECSIDIIGREGEGNTTRFEITVPTQKIGWSVYLDFTKPNGEKLRTPKLMIENGVVYYDVVPYLLTDDGDIKVQAVLISADNRTWKSTNKTYHIQDSIDADEAIPDKEDFFTQITRAIERIETMLGSLGGTIVVGYVDENNIITVAGDLPEGTYTAKYVMGDGSTIVIGDFEYDGSSSGGNSGGSSGGDTGGDTGGGSGETGVMVNLLDTAYDTDLKTVYNGVGWKAETRVTSAGVVEAGKDNILTGLIPLGDNGDVFHIKGVERVNYVDGAFSGYTSHYDPSGAFIKRDPTSACATFGTDENGDFTITLNHSTIPSGTAYIRFQFGEATGTVYITRNQLITV